MGFRLPFPRRWTALLAALLCLQACNSDNSVAGGSSEVDNPQVKVAFVDTAGAPVAFTGSVSLYLADQNPTLDPDALLKTQLSAATTVYLSASQLLTAGDTLRFNLLAQGGGNGALVKSFSYDSTSERVSVNGTTGPELKVVLVPLRRYTGTVDLKVNGPERVFVPGSPFQAVVVADSFAFEDLPEGVFPLRVYSSGGVEHEFPDSLDTREKQHFSLDTAAPPIHRPPPPEPQLEADAGADQSVFTNSEIFLSGKVSGVAKGDKRLGILWRQVPPDSGGLWAFIENPTSLNTRIYAWPGVYRFVLSATLGSKKVEDTVAIGVQQQPSSPLFFSPESGIQLLGGFPFPFPVRWFSQKPEVLDLDVSRDSGATWQPVANDIMAWYGVNEYPWVVPPGPPAPNCFLRLRAADGSTAATSARFGIIAWP